MTVNHIRYVCKIDWFLNFTISFIVCHQRNFKKKTPNSLVAMPHRTGGRIVGAALVSCDSIGKHQGVTGPHLGSIYPYVSLSMGLCIYILNNYIYIL